MSLILDALRKLERDKERPDPGVVVVGSIPWQGLRPRRRAPLAAGLLAVLVVASVGAVWLTRRSPTPTAATPLPAPRNSPSAAAVAAVASPQATRSTPSSTPLRLDPPPVARRLAAPTTAAVATSARSQPAPAPRPGPLQLMAISERDGQPIAIISDHLVHEGDSFDGIRILRIGQTEVEIEERGQRRVLRF